MSFSTHKYRTKTLFFYKINDSLEATRIFSKYTHFICFIQKKYGKICSSKGKCIKLTKMFEKMMINVSQNQQICSWLSEYPFLCDILCVKKVFFYEMFLIHVMKSSDNPLSSKKQHVF